MTEPEKKNWPKIIAEIEGAGVTLYKLSVMMNKQLHLVRRWTEKTIPKHHEGELLLSIHAEYVPRETIKIDVSCA